MAAINRHYRKKPQLNLTPLIDVIFLLIVFFMLTSKFSLDKVIDAGLAPVSSTSKKEEVNSDTVLVMLQENGDFKLWSRDGVGDSKVHSASKLRESIEPLLVRDKGRELIIVIDEGNNVQQAVTAIGELQQAGAEKIRLAEAK